MSIIRVKRKKYTVYRVKVMRNGRTVSKNFSNKRDAMLFERDVVLNEDSIGSKNFSFKEAAEEWLEIHAEVRKKGSGVLMDRIMLRKNIFPHLGHLKLDQIKPVHIDKLIALLRKDGLSNVTINRNLCVVRTIFNFFQSRKAIFNNPMTTVKSFKITNQSYSFWTLNDAQTFLEYTRQKYESGGRYATYLIYLTALNTGMRLGELLALQWPDVDFSNRVITVRRSYSCHERKIYSTTKSGHIRYVPINSDIYDELYAAYRRRGACELVFTWSGTVINPHNLRSRYFEKEVEESGVAKIRFHDLRHTFASHYMMNGGNLYDLQKILGHSNLRMTERYAHLS